jgi:all-trans-8'-apo-beta-carotenal 15,15'-oxygenase
MQSTHTSWNRRQWLGALAALGLGSLTSPRAHAATAETAWHSSYAPFDAPAFKGSLKTERLPVQGQLPAELRGTLYRNGPARFGHGSSRLTHWFDGDGMLQALRIDGGQVSHQGQLLDTPKAAQELAAGRFLYGGFGSTVANSLPVTQPDVINPANINLLSMDQGRKLYALWEAGSALEVYPDTLKSVGFKVWSPETAGAPFSAHPRVAPDGTVWSFGYMPGTGKLLIYQIAPNGQLQRQTVLTVPNADMVHDFAITERHLVFLLQPLKYERPASVLPNLLAGMHWDPQAPMIACVVAMADWHTTLIEMPNSGLFHLGNAFERGDRIHLSYVHHNDILRMRSFDVSPGLPLQEPLDTTWTEVELHTARRRATVRPTDLRLVEFPRFDPRRVGLPQKLTVMLQYTQAPRPLLGYSTVLTTDGQRTQRHDYGTDWLAEEHVYVPHPNKTDENAGWVLGTAYHWPTEKTTLSVFNAGQISAGPVAQVQLPYGLPLGLHGQFVALSAQRT